MQQAITARAVNVEDVGQFVYDDVFQPIVVISASERVNRWAGVDGDPVRGPHTREAIRGVDVIG